MDRKVTQWTGNSGNESANMRRRLNVGLLLGQRRLMFAGQTRVGRTFQELNK